MRERNQIERNQIDSGINSMNLVKEIFPGRWQGKMACMEPFLKDIQEIRIRIHAPVMVRIKGEEYGIAKDNRLVRWELCSTDKQGTFLCMEARDLEECLLHICHSSLYAYEDEIKRGYLTIAGGHRVGITGQVVMDEKGKIRTVKNISFLNVRIAHEIFGTAEKILPHLYRNGRVGNVLIISPPGFGKTTLLRDLVRQISNGSQYGRGRNCSLIDERSEIAGSFRGIPQLDIGMRTDVLDSCPKAIGMMMVIRSMGPEVVAVDELGTTEDIDALFSVIRSGCSILATIHGDDLKALQEKSFLRQVMKEKVFERYVFILDKHHNIEILDKELRKC